MTPDSNLVSIFYLGFSYEEKIEYQVKDKEDPTIPIIPNVEAQVSSAEEFDIQVSLGKNGDRSYWSSFLQRSDLHTFKHQAYVNPDGIAIRENPITHKKELFIAGSRTYGDWFSNLSETVDSAWDKVELVMNIKGMNDKIKKAYNAASWAERAEVLDPTGVAVMEEGHSLFQVSGVARDNYSSYIDGIISKYNVEVVYGHSRGAAVMSGLHSDVKKIGLDGATFIGHEGSDFVNLVNPSEPRSFAFDKLLSSGYDHNLSIPGKAFHDVTEEAADNFDEAISRRFKSKKLKPTPQAVERQKWRKRHKRDRKQVNQRLNVLGKFFGKKTTRQQKEQWLRGVKKRLARDGFTPSQITHIVERLREQT